MPIVGLIETPHKLPRSITEAVLGRDGGGGADQARLLRPQARLEPSDEHR